MGEANFYYFTCLKFVLLPVKIDQQSCLKSAPITKKKIPDRTWENTRENETSARNVTVTEKLRCQTATSTRGITKTESAMAMGRTSLRTARVTSANTSMNKKHGQGTF